MVNIKDKLDFWFSIYLIFCSILFSAMIARDFYPESMFNTYFITTIILFTTGFINLRYSIE